MTHARSTVIAVLAATTITVFDDDGTAILAITIDHRPHYGNGKRAGRPRTSRPVTTETSEVSGIS